MAKNRSLPAVGGTVSSIENLFIYVPIRHSTIVEDPLQIDPFMQNKAKVKIGKMNVNAVRIKAYDKKNGQTTTNVTKNKANRRPLAGNPNHEILNPKQNEWMSNDRSFNRQRRDKSQLVQRSESVDGKFEVFKGRPEG